MPKEKLKTPAWILESKEKPKTKKSGHCSVSPKALNSEGKTFRLRKCVKCDSDGVVVVIGKIGMWECKKCGWKGNEIKEEELSEDEFMKYLDEKGEEVA